MERIPQPQQPIPRLHGNRHNTGQSTSPPPHHRSRKNRSRNIPATHPHQPTRRTLRWLRPERNIPEPIQPRPTRRIRRSRKQRTIHPKRLHPPSHKPVGHRNKHRQRTHSRKTNRRIRNDPHPIRTVRRELQKLGEENRSQTTHHG